MPEKALGERVATVEAEMKEVRYDLYGNGNGRLGLIPSMQSFLAVQEDREKQAALRAEQDSEYDRKRDRSIKRWIAIAGVVAAFAKVIAEKILHL